MKKNIILFVLTLCLFAATTHSVSAIIQADFPDAQRGQPAPIGVTPNISNNIQDHGTVGPSTHVQVDTPVATNQSPFIKTTRTQKKSPLLLLIICFCVWIAGSSVYLYRTHHKKTAVQ